MKKIALGIGVLLLLAIILPAAATPNVKLEFVQDVATGGVGAVDMQGPTGFGFVNYNQDEYGNLRINAVLKNAEPYTIYHLYLTGGATHDTATGWIDAGILTTNVVGNGAVEVIIDFDNLLVAPFYGSGVAHLDLLQGVGDLSKGLYVVSPIEYDSEMGLGILRQASLAIDPATA